MISIDQGEELFSSEGADEAKKLLSLFRDILARETPSCLGLITIRSDAFEHLQTAAELETVPQQTFHLPPLAKGAYLEVIEGPARRLADTPREIRIEPMLSARCSPISKREVRRTRCRCSLLCWNVFIWSTAERVFYRWPITMPWVG